MPLSLGAGSRAGSACTTSGPAAGIASLAIARRLIQDLLEPAHLVAYVFDASMFDDSTEFVHAPERIAATGY